MTTSPLRLIGAASSAGAYGPGQELAPAAFRRHGLREKLESVGRSVTDVGDVALATFMPDPEHPRAGNVSTVAQVCDSVARVVAEAVGRGVPALILGGDCTIELGTVAGVLDYSDSVGLVYIDGDTDLNTPLTGGGILDWMGVGHMLGLPGAEPALVSLARRSPMLTPDAVRFVAADNSNADERLVLDALKLKQHTIAECMASPDAVGDALAEWAKDFEHILIHVDIDVLDGGAFPIAENTRTIPGLSLGVLGILLDRLCHLPNFTSLTLCEVTPANARDEQQQFAELVSMLGTAFRTDRLEA